VQDPVLVDLEERLASGAAWPLTGDDAKRPTVVVFRPWLSRQRVSVYPKPPAPGREWYVLIHRSLTHPDRSAKRAALTSLTDG
jgi:hypothetical protein